MFRWVQDWRERRAAVRELRQEQDRDEAALADMADNPLLRARSAIESGNPVAAAQLWEEACARMPGVIIGSDDSLAILLGLERLDEAEALIQERRKRSRDDRFCLPALARIAETRGDMVEAAKRWEAVRAIVKDNLEGHFHGNLCLRSLGRLHEAAALMDDAMRREPGSADAWMERASIAEKLGDRDEALRLWKAAVDRFGFAKPLTGYVRMLTESGRADEARACLYDLARAHPGDLDIVAARARLARQMGDLAAAVERWAEGRAIFLYFQPAYQEAIDCLRVAGDEAAAEALSREAIAQFPDKSWSWIAFARLAHDRQEWHAAAARWEEVRQRFPGESAGHTLGEVALKAVDGLSGAAAPGA